MSSAASSVRNSLRHQLTSDTLNASHGISLVDQERRARRGADDTEPNTDSEAPTAPSTPGPSPFSPLSKKLTANSLQLQQSLKREWTRRKYAKYDRGRYKINDGDNEDRENIDPEHPPDEEGASNVPQLGEPATAQQTSYLERGQAKVKSLLKRKRTLGAGKHTEDTVVDVLYENQRGMFLFGIPKYSSSSLLPSDPKPWQNAQFRTSPVDIRNAQVPDPSWEWAWKSWYVDMSRDVDEEGWEYSFQFNGGFAWHGNHPWFHSFVRRRRWLRMRKRRAALHKTKEKAHEFTAEYFTIHPRTVRSPPEDVSQMAESELAKLLREKEDEIQDVEKMEIADIGSLTLALRKAAVDREKLVAVRKFVKDSGDELFYLSDRMPEIMSLFVFQSSRKQLLTDLLQRYDETSRRKESLTGHEHDDDQAQKDHDTAQRRAENLMKAVQAADEQVKKLEYWSDIKGMAQRGDTLDNSAGGKWDGEKWQGLASPSSPEGEHPLEAFRNKQDASEGVQQLHGHAEHGDDTDCKVEKDKAVQTKESSVFYDTRTKQSSDDTQGAYMTAAESTSELGPRQSGGKGKARAGASSLDGVLEGEDDTDAVDAAAQTEDGELDPDTGLPFMTPPEQTMVAGAQPKTPYGSAVSRQQSVQIVDPVPEPEDLPSPTLKSGGEGS